MMAAERRLTAAAVGLGHDDKLPLPGRGALPGGRRRGRALSAVLDRALSAVLILPLGSCSAPPAGVRAPPSRSGAPRVGRRDALTHAASRRLSWDPGAPPGIR